MNGLPVIKVLVVEDSPVVREFLVHILGSDPDIRVVGTAHDGEEALDVVRRTRPDVITMDIHMPRLNGLEATARLRKAWPTMRVVILSMHQNEEYVRQALHNGAVAYILKDAAPQELEQALQAVLRGDTYLSPAIAKRFSATRTALQASPHTAQLTPRQVEVLRLVAQGLSSKEIARNLDVSVKTVDTHRTSLMRQLDIHEVAGLVRYAIRTGLIPSGL